LTIINAVINAGMNAGAAFPPYSIFGAASQPGTSHQP
jgi:hypothetical protein